MSELLVFSHLTVIMGFLLSLLVLAHLVRERRSPTGTLAWFLIIVLAPYLGVPLYLAFGGRKMRKMAASKANLVLAAEDELPEAEATPIDRLLRSYQIPGATRSNQVEICIEGEAGYAALTGLIASAHRNIYLTIFIFSPDEVGRDIIARLAQRAAEGIEVRMLLDGAGSWATTRGALNPLTEAGGYVAYFNPLLLGAFRANANLRNHRKLAVVDGARAWAGGTNIASEYIGAGPDPKRWLDLSFLLAGSAARYYDAIFRSDWAFASGEALHHYPPIASPQTEDTPTTSVQVIPSGPDVPADPLYTAILSASFQARQRIWIITPYFIPDDALTHAWTIAAHRGVDVRIIVPKHSDNRIIDLARRGFLRDIQAAGGKVFRFPGNMLHTKALLLDDDFVALGSANMDARSLFLNYEVVSFFYGQKEISTIAIYFLELEANAIRGVRSVGRVRELLGGIARMVAPLL